MDIRQMRQVVALTTHGSFVKAAQELGIAQPTLSKSIARLEDEMGLRLFDRSGAGASPTPIGQFVSDRARQIIVETTRLTRDVDLANSGQVGRVRMGFGPALAPVFASRLALLLAKRYPRLGLSLFVEQRANMFAGLLDGKLDLLFIAAGEDLRKMDLSSTEVMHERLMAVASPQHPLAGRAGITGAELARFPGASNTSLRNFMPGALLGLSSEMEDLSSHFVANEFAVSRALVIGGAAVAIGFEHLYRDDIKSGQLVRLDISFPQRVRVMAVATAPSAHSALLTSIIGLATTLGGELALEDAGG